MTKKWHHVPSDWRMSDDLLKWTKSKGLTDNQIEDQLERFRDHQYIRPKLCADRCWRNWVRFAIEKGLVVPVQKTRYRGPETVSEEQRTADILAFENDPLIRRAKR